MCGVHNYTKDLTIQNLHSFVMKAATEFREKVIIDCQFGAKSGIPYCTVIQFFNVSFVKLQPDNKMSCNQSQGWCYHDEKL